MVLIIAGGMLAINQTFGWYYKAQFLKSPCYLCVELNPAWEKCYEFGSAEIPKDNISVNTSGLNWSKYIVKK